MTDRKAIPCGSGGDVIGRDRGADRKTTTQVFGYGQHVRPHAIDLVGEHFAKLAEPRLGFVVDQQRAALIELLAQALQILDR